MSDYLVPALNYIRSQQQADGSFKSLSSSRANFSTPASVEPTIFPSLLILDCLSSVAAAHDICARLSEYVRNNMSASGAWNYQGMAPSPAYPDDLDDTACALAALTNYDRTLVDGQLLGKFARLLVTAEAEPGGPYNTWLIDTAEYPQWGQIDLGVNANIGYALSLHGVQLKNLEQYVTNTLLDDALTSDYYLGEVPLLYFLARWYRGPAYEKLRNNIRLSASAADCPLEVALLLAAARQVELEPMHLEPLTRKLLASQQDGSWPAAGLYINSLRKHQTDYSGSAALTTAFAVQALQVKPSTKPSKRLIEPVGLVAELATITDPGMRRQYHYLASALATNPGGDQISRPANLLAPSNHSVPIALVTDLNWGSLHGWVAYTLQDTVLDGSPNLSQLTTANLALRRSLQRYYHALPHHQPLVENVFDTMDAANAWEQRHARLPVDKPPDYGDYYQLAERSWGHSLAARGILLHFVPDIKHPVHRILDDYYQHFLIARQLNDDAHDWEEDLQHGQLTAVLTQMEYTQPLLQLRQQFWETTIVTVAGLIELHLAAAHEAIPGLAPYLQTATLQAWLDDLQRATHAALDGREQSLQFIAGYSAEATA